MKPEKTIHKSVVRGILRLLLLALLAVMAWTLLVGCGGEPAVRYVRLTFRQSGCADVIRNIPYGTEATGIPVPQPKEGYTVTWDMPDLSHVTEEKIIYAVETPNTYTLTLDPNGGYCSTEKLQVTYGFACSLPTPVKAGYTFLGWYDGETAVSDGEIWRRAADITLQAHWQADSGDEPDTVTVRFVQQGQPDILRTIRKGESLADIPAPAPRTGYTVTWDRTDFTAIAQDLTVTAKETPNVYSVTLDLSGVADAEISAVSIQVTYGTTLTLPVPQSETHRFLRWVIRGTDTEVGDGIYAYARDLDLVAVWEEEQWSDLH